MESKFIRKIKYLKIILIKDANYNLIIIKVVGPKIGSIIYVNKLGWELCLEYICLFL